MKKETERRIGCTAVTVLYVIAWAAILIALCGCTTTKYVPAETVRTEFRDRDVVRMVNDTVRDTRFVYIKGDTVVDWRERTNTCIVEVHDTVAVVKTDSVTVHYAVERKLTRWEQAKQDVGGAAIWIMIAAIGIAVVWLVKKFRK